MKDRKVLKPRHLSTRVSTGLRMLGMGLLGPILAFAGDGIIHNDTVWRDTAGSEIWCNGGHVIREGGLFYWVG